MYEFLLSFNGLSRFRDKRYLVAENLRYIFVSHDSI